MKRDKASRDKTDKLHELFWSIVTKLPSDFEPYGQRSRTKPSERSSDCVSDCSGDCKHFQVLQAMPYDWGVCTNPKSPRCGLLTFEHQGCYEYEQDATTEEEGCYEDEEDTTEAAELIFSGKQQMSQAGVYQDVCRGLLVLDKDLEALSCALRDRDIMIIVRRPGEDDEAIKEDLLRGRIFVTNNSKDFIMDGTSYEYNIIGTEEISIEDPKALATMISRAMIQYKLWTKPYCWILKLKPDGNHKLERLPR